MISGVVFSVSSILRLYLMILAVNTLASSTSHYISSTSHNEVISQSNSLETLALLLTVYELPLAAQYLLHLNGVVPMDSSTFFTSLVMTPRLARLMPFALSHFTLVSSIEL